MSLKAKPASSSSSFASISGSSTTTIINTSTRTEKSFLKRRFSAQKMLAKAKDTTKSLVHEVLDKRSSSESKRSAHEDYQIPNSSSSNSLASQKKSSAMEENGLDNDSTSNNHKKTILRTLSSRPKHYSLPIKRPFVIKRNTSTRSLESSSSNSMVTNTTASSLAVATTDNADTESMNPAAAAETDILNGEERPGSFATACDFRLANDKRNEEFHALFKSVQEKDMLIQGTLWVNKSHRESRIIYHFIDYKCALQKEILLQGHLYVSENHVCFKSNIFGWVTNVSLFLSSIIQKRCADLLLLLSL